MDTSNITIVAESDEFRIRRMTAEDNNIAPGQRVGYPHAMKLLRESEALAVCQYEIAVASILAGGTGLSCRVAA